MTVPTVAAVDLTVRPYVLTGGRTTSDADLALSDFVTTTDLGRARHRELQLERSAIVALVASPTAVSALTSQLALPPMVVKVLVGDLVTEGLLTIVESPGADDGETDVDLLGQVLDGLERL